MVLIFQAGIRSHKCAEEILILADIDTDIGFMIIWETLYIDIFHQPLRSQIFDSFICNLLSTERRENAHFWTDSLPVLIGHVLRQIGEGF